MFSNFLSENRDNMEKYRRARQTRDYNTIRSIRNKCWKPKVTNKHSEYVILTVLSGKQWLHESASLRYTYTA